MKRLLAFCAIATMPVAACAGDSGGSNATTSVATSVAPTTALTTTEVTTTEVTTTTAAPTTTSPAPTTTSPVPTTTLAPTTTSPAPTTTLAPTTTPAATTTEPCDRPTNLDPVDVNYPQIGRLGVEIRTGAHPCFERIVIEFAPGPGAFPGYRVEYVDDPLALGASGEEVDLRGDANLVIFVASWMGDIEQGGYQGPWHIFPTNVVHIEELALLDNFEAMHIWGVGLDEVRPFRVFTLTDPGRLVVDIASD